MIKGKNGSMKKVFVCKAADSGSEKDHLFSYRTQ